MSKKQIEKLKNDLALFERERKDYLKEFNFWDRKFNKAKKKLQELGKIANQKTGSVKCQA